MFRSSRASVLRGARLIGRRSLHRREPLGSAAITDSAAAATSSAEVGVLRSGLHACSVRSGSTSGSRSARFSHAAGMRVEASGSSDPAVRGQQQQQQQGERFPSLLITADAITAQ